MEETGLEKVKRLVVLLVSPSKYDEDGNLICFWRGVLPSSSLTSMYGLTQAAFTREEFSDIKCESYVFSETVWSQRIRFKKMLAKHLDDETRVVVGLVGVQTNQFPRAWDLANEAHDAGATVVIGGFHVSGTMKTMYYGIDDPHRADIPCPQIIPNEIQALEDKGIIVFVGECEDIWHQVLIDIVSNTPKKRYHAKTKPDLSTSPLPQLPPEYLNGFATRIATIDTGRGCPFKCSFCTVINVQGRQCRWRETSAIIDLIRKNYEDHGIRQYFFTDDNFVRNPKWEDILDGIIFLRSQGYEINFIAQIDTVAIKIKCQDKKTTFIQKLAQAGCNQVFIGVESLNPKTLQRIKKTQNNPENYKELFDELRKNGVSIHAAYMIGFAEDTYESVIRSVEKLKKIGPDLATFFCVTPLPGSEDHIRYFLNGNKIHTDYNKYDSFQPVVEHPLMTRRQWKQAYDDAWKMFYNTEYMAEVLERLNTEKSWAALRNFFWYRNSFMGHGMHPMICGFLQIKTRKRDRRHGYKPEGLIRFWSKEISRYFAYFLFFCLKEIFIFQRVFYNKKIIRLSKFWHRYKKQKWRLALPWKWHWHLRMLPRAVMEFILGIKWVVTLRLKLKKMKVAYRRKQK